MALLHCCAALDCGFLPTGVRFCEPKKRHGLKQIRRVVFHCQGWFQFDSDLPKVQKNHLNIGDFKIISHLKDIGYGDLVSKPKGLHFRGCINESYSVDCVGGKFFVKINRFLPAADMFAGEHEALLKLHAAQAVRVPQPFGYGDLPDGGSYIILEHLDFLPFGMMRKKSQEDLGKSLAMLHQVEVGDMFGFPSNTRLGVIPLDNTWTISWEAFFVEKRLKDRLLRAYAVLGDSAKELQAKESTLLTRARDILNAHDCKPSILHGDLWMGNTGLMSTGEIAIFDPAAFIGDAEFELAFQGWSPVPGFPGFSDAFYESYHKILPQRPGFQDRHKIYQLFHLLNHLLIYGLEYYQYILALVNSVI